MYKYFQWFLAVLVLVGVCLCAQKFLQRFRDEAPTRESRRRVGSVLLIGESMMEYQGQKFMKSRIPPLDVLTAFVPNGHEKDEAILKADKAFGFCRWYPMEGGNRVEYLYEGGPYDEKYFQIKKGAWDHEHCENCGRQIPSMELCWVAESGPFVVLCTECYTKLNEGKQ